MTDTLELTAAGFLFDMDGTLVDSTAVVEALWGRFADRHGLDLGEILAYSHGRQTLDTVERFLPHTDPDKRQALAREIVADELTRTAGITEVPGAAALMTALADAGAPVALVTSAPLSLAEQRMTAAGVPMPSVVVAAENASPGKPSPEPYLVAARALGLRAEDCVAFEDAEAGLTAALASGATVVVVGPHESPTTAGLSRVADLTGLRWSVSTAS